MNRKWTFFKSTLVFAVMLISSLLFAVSFVEVCTFFEGTLVFIGMLFTSLLFAVRFMEVFVSFESLLIYIGILIAIVVLFSLWKFRSTRYGMDRSHLDVNISFNATGSTVNTTELLEEPSVAAMSGFTKSTILETELFKATVLLRHRLVDQPLTSRDADVTVLKTVASVCHRWMVAASVSGDLKRVKRLFHDNAQLLFTLSEPPIHSKGRPRSVAGVLMLDNFVYVVYERYNKVQVFDCEDCYKKVEDIEIKGMSDPWEMVGSSVTSQLFIHCMRYVIRVDLKTGVSDAFIKLDESQVFCLSLVENRLLVTSCDSLLMYDIHSGERIKKIPLTEGWKGHLASHAIEIESNRDSFLVCHGPPDNVYDDTVSEIDSEGRVIRVFDNEERLHCWHLALDSVGRLLVTDLNNGRVVLLDEYLKFKRILIDNKRLGTSWPMTMNYNKNNNRLAVGLENGQVKIFDCNV